MCDSSDSEAEPEAPLPQAVPFARAVVDRLLDTVFRGDNGPPDVDALFALATECGYKYPSRADGVTADMARRLTAHVPAGASERSQQQRAVAWLRQPPHAALEELNDLIDEVAPPPFGVAASGSSDAKQDPDAKRQRLALPTGWTVVDKIGANDVDDVDMEPGPPVAPVPPAPAPVDAAHAAARRVAAAAVLAVVKGASAAAAAEAKPSEPAIDELNVPALAALCDRLQQQRDALVSQMNALGSASVTAPELELLELQESIERVRERQFAQLGDQLDLQAKLRESVAADAKNALEGLQRRLTSSRCTHVNESEMSRLGRHAHAEWLEGRIALVSSAVAAAQVAADKANAALESVLRAWLYRHVTRLSPAPPPKPEPEEPPAPAPAALAGAPAAWKPQSADDTMPEEELARRAARRRTTPAALRATLVQDDLFPMDWPFHDPFCALWARSRERWTRPDMALADLRFLHEHRFRPLVAAAEEAHELRAAKAAALDASARALRDAQREVYIADTAMRATAMWARECEYARRCMAGKALTKAEAKEREALAKRDRDARYAEYEQLLRELYPAPWEDADVDEWVRVFEGLVWNVLSGPDWPAAIKVLCDMARSIKVLGDTALSQSLSASSGLCDLSASHTQALSIPTSVNPRSCDFNTHRRPGLRLDEIVHRVLWCGDDGRPPPRVVDGLHFEPFDSEGKDALYEYCARKPPSWLPCTLRRLGWLFISLPQAQRTEACFDELQALVQQRTQTFFAQEHGHAKFADEVVQMACAAGPCTKPTPSSTNEEFLFARACVSLAEGTAREHDLVDDWLDVRAETAELLVRAHALLGTRTWVCWLSRVEIDFKQLCADALRGCGWATKLLTCLFYHLPVTALRAYCRVGSRMPEGLLCTARAAFERVVATELINKAFVNDPRRHPPVTQYLFDVARTLRITGDAGFVLNRLAMYIAHYQKLRGLENDQRLIRVAAFLHEPSANTLRKLQALLDAAGPGTKRGGAPPAAAAAGPSSAAPAAGAPAAVAPSSVAPAPAPAPPAQTLEQFLTARVRPRTDDCARCRVARDPAAADARAAYGTVAECGTGHARDVGRMRCCIFAEHGVTASVIESCLDGHPEGAKLRPQKRRQSVEKFMLETHGVLPLGNSPAYKVALALASFAHVAPPVSAVPPLHRCNFTIRSQTARS